jgi:hypothetical protein
MDNTILFLRGYHLKDYQNTLNQINGVFIDEDLDEFSHDGTDDIVEESLSPVQFASSKPWEAMPSQFTDLSSWPEHLHLCCHSCSLVIEEMPIPLVTSVEVISVHRGFKNQNYIVDGVCCSPPCLKNLIEEHPNRDRIHDLNMEVIGIIYGLNCPDLPLGLPRHRLSKFAGPSGLSESEYRQQHRRIWLSYVDSITNTI